MKTLDEMRARLIEKAEGDLAFRSKLMADPRAVVQEEFGIEVPEQCDVRVHEDGPSAVHLVLPPEPRLEIQEMRSAAGGRPYTQCAGLSWG